MDWLSCSAYLDDVLTFFFRLNITYHLEEVLGLFETVLIYDPKKHNFGKKNVQILGFDVSSHSVLSSKENTSAITAFSRSHTGSEVKQFFGLSELLRRHVRNVSTITESQHRLERENGKFEWNCGQDFFFVTLPDALMNRPILSHYNTSRLVMLHTDASGIG